MLEQYFPILVLLLVVVAFVVLNLVLSSLAGRHRASRGKATTYECGMETPGEAARGRFSVKFFLVAVLFILFDIESVFLIPWGINLRDLAEAGHGTFLLVEMLTFIGILAIGFVYVWKKGALEWD
ncbi:MAG: NADH-quinone oxidoreductase subunit A [Planctomycetota bacterium]